MWFKEREMLSILRKNQDIDGEFSLQLNFNSTKKWHVIKEVNWVNNKEKLFFILEKIYKKHYWNPEFWWLKIKGWLFMTK
jgi:hypothetical protein